MHKIDLTDFQRKLWLDWKTNPNSKYYNMHLQYLLEGKLDIERLNKSLNRVVSFFPALRTYFTEDGTIPRQIVIDEVESSFVLLNCEGEIKAHSERQNILNQNLDLLSFPICRYFIIKYDGDRYFMIITIPHIISDDTSLSLFTKYLAKFYNSDDSQVSFSPDVTLYHNWKSKTITRKAEKEATLYWQKILADAKYKVEFKLPKPNSSCEIGQRYRFQLPENLTKRLRDFATKEKTTIFNTMMSLYKIMIYHFFNDNDVLIAYPANARPRENNFKEIFGFYVNMMLQRCPIENKISFKDLVHTISAQRKKENSYRYFDIIGLASKLQKTLQNVTNIPFNAMISETSFSEELVLNDVQSSAIRQDFKEAIADIGLYYDVSSTQMECAFEYKNTIFDSDLIQNIHLGFINIISSALNNPDEQIANLEYTDNSQKKKILSEWNNTAYDLNYNTTLHQLFETQAQKSPDNVAVIFGNDALSYLDLNNLSNKFAHFLIKCGIAQKDIVALAVNRSINFPAIILAILKVGATYLPIDPTSPDGRIENILNNSKPSLVLIDEEKKSSFFKNKKINTINISKIKLEKYGENSPGIFVSSDLIANLLYTSGSTGMPKGVLLPHKGLVNRILWMQKEFKLQSSTKVIHKTPLTFDVAGWEIFWPILFGATLVVGKPGIEKDPILLADEIERHCIDVIHFVPSVLQIFMNVVEKGRCESLKQVFCSGEALTTKLSKRFFDRFNANIELYNLYGPTEASIDVTHCNCKNFIESKNTYIPIGRPISNIQVYILNKFNKTVLPGFIGEIYLSGIGLAKGYLNNPNITNERFVLNPFKKNSLMYKTGDLGYYSSDGNINYLGRTDFEFKYNGVRIHPAEIEKVVLNVSEVSATLVNLDSNESGNSRLVVYFTSIKSEEIEDIKEKIFKKLRIHFPIHMLPSILIHLEKFPLLPNGKIDRTKLTIKNTKNTKKDKIPEELSNIEKTLISIWAETLHVKGIGIDDNFMNLGGDSMRAIEVVFKCRQQDIIFDVHTLYTYPTIRELKNNIQFQKQEAAKTINYYKAFDLLDVNDKNILLSKKNIEDAYPANRLLLELIYRSKIEVRSYEIYTTTYKVKGIFDLAKLTLAANSVIQSQNFLRSNIDVQNFSKILILIHKTAKVEIPVLDLKTKPINIQKKKYKKWLSEEKNNRFSWDALPLLRINIHLMNEEEFWITISEPWLDGWSVSVVASQIFEIYVELLKSSILKQMPKINSSMRNFIELEISSINSKKDQDFWSNQISSVKCDPIFESSYDRNSNYQIRKHVVIPHYYKLLDIAKANNVNIKHVLLAAHIKVLSTISGKNDLVIGIMENGRPEIVDADKIAGLFLTPIPLRINLKEYSWSKLIREIYKIESECLRHRWYPISQIQKDCGLENIFDTIFNFINFRNYNTTNCEQFELLSVEGNDRTYLPLTVHFSLNESNNSITMCVDIDSRIMSKKQRERLCQYYKNALNIIINNPDLEHSHYSIMGPKELEQILTFSSNQKSFTEDISLYFAFNKTVQKNSKKTAIIDANREISFIELDDMVDKITFLLSENQVTLGSIVAIYLPRSIELVASILAILKYNCTYLPLDPNYSDERINFMINDSKVSFLIAESRSSIKNITRPCSTIYLKALKTEHMKSKFSEVKKEALYPAYVIYTSGSTGLPKGVVGTHKNVFNRLKWMWEKFPFFANEMCLLKTSINFIDSVWEIFGPLLSGRTLVLAPNESAKNLGLLVDILKKYNIKRIFIVPSLLKLLLDSLSKHDRALDLHYWFVGGEALSKQLVADFVRLQNSAKLINLYGATELTADASFYEIDPKNLPLGSIPIGKPIRNSQIYILGDNFEPVPIGLEGNIIVGGEVVSSGYLNNVELTKKTYIPAKNLGPFLNNTFFTTLEKRSDILYCTGDRGRLIEDGNVEYLGRRDTQIKIRGNKVNTETIINAIQQNEFVIDSYLKVLDGTLESLVAYISLVPLTKRDVALEIIKSSLKSQLPGFMLPDHFIFLEKIPLLPNGKVNTKQLPGPVINKNKLASNIYPRSSIEKKIVLIWKKILKIENISIDDKFDSLGGHSLSIIQVIANLEKEFNINLANSRINESATVRTLAKSVETALLFPLSKSNLKEDDCLIKLNESSSGLPVVLIHPASGRTNIYAGILENISNVPIYLIKSPTMLGIRSKFESMDEVADYYYNIISKHISGEYIIGGYSLGGTIGLEVARRTLNNTNLIPKTVFMIDSFPFDNSVPSLVNIDEEYNFMIKKTEYQNAEFLNAIKKEFVQNYSLYLKYVQKPYDGKIVLLSTRDKALNTWKKNYYQSMSTKKISGTHYSIFDEKHLNATLKAIKHVIQNCYK